jgi:hypothetical protein
VVKNGDPSLWEPVYAEPTQTITDDLELCASRYTPDCISLWLKGTRKEKALSCRLPTSWTTHEDAKRNAL